MKYYYVTFVIFVSLFLPEINCTAPKHNGMSWSKHGSVSLALITSTVWNKEHQKWFQEGEIDFLLPAA